MGASLPVPRTSHALILTALCCQRCNSAISSEKRRAGREWTGSGRSSSSWFVAKRVQSLRQVTSAELFSLQKGHRFRDLKLKFERGVLDISHVRSAMIGSPICSWYVSRTDT